MDRNPDGSIDSTRLMSGRNTIAMTLQFRNCKRHHVGSSIGCHGHDWLLFSFNLTQSRPMVPLPLQLKEEARRGDVAALLSVHAFCKERNVGDHSTFIAIIDIVLHNFRPELHPPGLSYLTNFPKAYRKWLKLVAICTCTLVFSIDSMLAAFPAIASTLQPLPPPSCRKLAKYWEGSIWPCVSALIYWYISDDVQPPVSAHIQQETLNTEVSKLLQYLSQTRIGLLPRMKESPEVPPTAARLMIQALDWYPHPSSAYTKALSTLIHGRSDSIKDSISVIKELENNPQYLPGLVAFISAHTTQLVERISEVHWVFTLAGMAFQSSLQLVRRAGTQFPTLIPKLMKALHYFDYAPSLPACLTLPQPRVFITSVAGVIGEITKSGGYLAQRQALRRGILWNPSYYCADQAYSSGCQDEGSPPGLCVQPGLDNPFFLPVPYPNYCTERD